MYKGPFYYHQPGSRQHKRTGELLEIGIGDGVIIPVKTTRKVSDKTLENFIEKCQGIGKSLLLDTENYNPEEFITSNPEDGSKILLESKVRNQYIQESLAIQHLSNCSGYIIPNFETTSVSPSWYSILTELSRSANEWIAKNGNTELPKYLTLAIPSSDIIDPDNSKELLNNIISLKQYVDGFYINIIGIPEILIDYNLYRSLLNLVFKLKWQEFGIILSKAGPWIFTMFPLGLEIFGSGGFKSQQTVKSKREVDSSGGWGGSKFDNVWSPESLSYIRYPDDAVKIHEDFSEDEKKKLYGSKYGYAPPVDKNPDNVYRSKGYKQKPRLNNYSASMAGLANDFQNLTLNERISSVQNKLRASYEAEQKIGSSLRDDNRGSEKLIWLEVFEKYVDYVREDLEDLFE